MKDMALNTHLQERGSVYYFRCRVPADIVDDFGQTEIKISLGTKDRRKAKMLLANKAIEVEKEFAEVRSRLFADLSAPVELPLSPSFSQTEVPLVS